MMFSVNVFASEQTDALDAYRSWLSDSSTVSLIYSEQTYEMQRSEFEFAVVYLDADSIPEMLIYHPALPAELGRVMVFTYDYSAGKIEYVININSDVMDEMGYYPGKGLVTSIYIRKENSNQALFDFCKYDFAQMSYTGIGKILKPEGGSWKRDSYVTDCEITSKSTFSDALKEEKGTTSFTELVFRTNTEDNRANYVR